MSDFDCICWLYVFNSCHRHKKDFRTDNKQSLVFLPTTNVIKNNDNQYFIGSYHYYFAANVQSGVED